jgi:hypothetical protein
MIQAVNEICAVSAKALITSGSVVGRDTGRTAFVEVGPSISPERKRIAAGGGGCSFIAARPAIFGSSGAIG